jgi:hypothetical protein
LGVKAASTTPCNAHILQIEANDKGATTFSVTTLSITILSLMGLIVTLSIYDTQVYSIERHNDEWRFFFAMLSVDIMNLVLLSVIRPNVVAPLQD